MFRLPNDSQHMAIIGQNGSGKTVFGVWALSKSTFDHQPKVIIDYKRDALIEAIEGLEEIDYNYVPRHPGLYIIRATKADDERLERWFYRAVEQENVGVYIDEGLEVPQNFPRYSGLRTLLTQGRSKQCPVTILMQRPSQVSKFIFSESSFFAVFRLQADSDKARIGEFTPSPRVNRLWNLDVAIPRFECRWFDATEDYSAILLPAPPEDEILQTFYDRVRLRRRVF